MAYLSLTMALAEAQDLVCRSLEPAGTRPYGKWAAIQRHAAASGWEYKRSTPQGVQDAWLRKTVELEGTCRAQLTLRSTWDPKAADRGNSCADGVSNMDLAVFIDDEFGDAFPADLAYCTMHGSHHPNEWVSVQYHQYMPPGENAIDAKVLAGLRAAFPLARVEVFLPAEESEDDEE